MGDEKRTRRQFSSEDKAEAVKRHLLGGEAVSAICEDLGIAPNLFYRWQKELFEHGAAAFEVKGRGMGRARYCQILCTAVSAHPISSTVAMPLFRARHP